MLYIASHLSEAFLVEFSNKNTNVFWKSVFICGGDNNLTSFLVCEAEVWGNENWLAFLQFWRFSNRVTINLKR